MIRSASPGDWLLMIRYRARARKSCAMSPEETLSADADGDEIRSRLVAAAGKVRHPSLVLSSFTTGLAEVSRDEDDELADADADDSVPKEEREQARLRRAALLVAALDIVDWCIDDLRHLHLV